MENLAGNQKADKFILDELEKAGIPVEHEVSNDEVPYTVVGKLGNWKFERAWYYWKASVPKGEKGLPFEVAVELHERKYPIDEVNVTLSRPINVSTRKTEVYGQVIRVVGHCGCPHPREWAFPLEEECIPQLEKLEAEGKLEDIIIIRNSNEPIPKNARKIDYITRADLIRLCDSGAIQGEKFINKYHIDTQLGLNEFSRVIKESHNLIRSALVI